jgi:hypothetical protein
LKLLAALMSEVAAAALFSAQSSAARGSALLLRSRSPKEKR